MLMFTSLFGLKIEIMAKIIKFSHTLGDLKSLGYYMSDYLGHHLIYATESPLFQTGVFENNLRLNSRKCDQLATN